ncbi:MAG TPA: hypothetical protein VIC55_04875 [Gemmatimonadaceae bacterium]|jgi:hypothetical protein
MLTWLVAALSGVGIAGWLYGWRDGGGGRGSLRWALVVLRAVAMAMAVALLFDAPAGMRHALPPLIALDASQSWTRDGDTTLWHTALNRARALARDSLLVFGDSVRRAPRTPVPADLSTRARALAELALGAGRPLLLISDGELDDPSAIPGFPSGSRITIVPHPPVRDVAIVALDAPRAAVSGDTVELRVTVRADSLSTPPGTLRIVLSGRELASTPIDSLPPRAERTLTVRARIAGPEGPAVLAAVVAVPGDVEPRNDTLAVAVDVARAAGAVLVSTSPDFDVRFMLPVLRGAVALPTRAYYRVAPGEWRQDGTLAAVDERAVRNAVHDAPLAILHGDTSYFGPPRTATTGSLALVAPPSASDSTGEWYAVDAPASPISASLAGVSWDSLPPITVSSKAPHGDWDGLIVARARQFDRRPAIAGVGSAGAGGRRVVVVGASGFWRWQFRGGATADAYVALWGSIFDWLSAERPDARAASPAEGVLRAGDPIRWRRGTSSHDSVVVAVLRKHGDTRDDSVAIRFGGGATVAQTDPMPPGVYDVRVPGGAAVLVVNPSRELLPRTRSVVGGSVGGAAAFGNQRRLRDQWWAYVVLLGALCAEWLLRRRRGLR